MFWVWVMMPEQLPNMEGQAKIETFDYIGDDPATAPLLAEMRNRDATPRICNHVWISYLTGARGGDGEGFGKLTSGYGSRPNPAEDGGKIGPEFTFGIYTQKLLDQPILIIKTAWGGKSLHTDFRPPSAGPYELNQQQVEQTRMEANRQVRYLTTSVRPVPAEEPSFPRKFENTILAFLIFSGIYLMISLTASILREQVSS